MGWEVVALLALLSAFIHAFWNAAGKKWGARPSDSFLGILIAGALISVVGLIFVGLPHTATWKWIPISALFVVVYYLMYLRALDDTDYVLIYPIARGVVPLVLLANGWIFWSGALNLYGLVGFALVLIGFILFFLLPIWGREKSVRFKDICNMALALFAGISIGVSLSIDNAVLRLNNATGPYEVAAYVFALLIAINLTVAVIFQLRGREPIEILRRDGRISWGGGVASTLSFLVGLIAYTQAPAGLIGLVSVLRETNVLFAPFFAYFLLKEKISLEQGFAIAAMGAGAVLIKAAA